MSWPSRGKTGWRNLGCSRSLLDSGGNITVSSTRDPEVNSDGSIDIYFAPEAPEGWEQIASYGSSGEAECWCCGSDREEETCLLCEGDGIVYIGEGWAEVVYRRKA